MKDLLGSGVDVSKRTKSIIADICDGDRLGVNDKSETGEEVEMETVALVENQSSIMADSREDGLSEVKNETKVGDRDDASRRGGSMKTPVSLSQLCFSLLPSSSPFSCPSAPSRASFTVSSLQRAPQMKT